MPELFVSVKTLEAALLGSEAPPPSVSYRVNVKISEEERNPGYLRVRFSFELEAEPPIAKLQISGTAQVTGKEEELLPLLSQNAKEGAPPLFMLIYQKVYPVMYLLANALKIPHPAPGLLKIGQGGA